MATDSRNYYEVLQVDPRAETEVIEAAYKRLARKYHPDADKTPGAQERMKHLNEAYDVLRDPVKRRAYDAKLASAPPSPGPATPHAVPPDIRVSKALLQFGRLTKGETNSLSFVITNVGGPVTTIHIDWEKEPDWAELVIRPDPNTTFPIEVEIRVDSNKANPGLRQAKIVIDADGVNASVDISATVIAPAPQPTPTPPPHPPTPPSPAPPTPRPTTNLPTWIYLAIAVGVVLLLCVAANIMNTNNINTQKAQATQQAVAIPATIPFLLSVVENDSYHMKATIKVVDVQGHIKSRVSFNDIRIGKIAWSPDGSRIAFTCYKVTTPTICISKADGTAYQELLPYSSDYIPDPDWSPDRTKITFFYHQGCGITDGGYISVIDVDGSKMRRLTDGCIKVSPQALYASASPVWSPDGTKIAFIKDAEVYVVGQEGGEPQQISKRKERHLPYYGSEIFPISSPTWSPDGKKLAYGASHSVCVLNADGSNERCIEKEKNIYGWYPNPAWSPDGKWIAIDNCEMGDQVKLVCILSADGAIGPLSIPIEREYPGPAYPGPEYPAWLPN